MQCIGYTKNAERCKNITTNPNSLCWRHQKERESKEIEQEIYPLQEDIELLTYGYLTLEEILQTFENNKVLRDKIIKLYKSEMPLLSDAIKLNNLMTIRYLIEELGVVPTLEDLNLSIKYHNNRYEYKIYEYLRNVGVKPDIITLNKFIREFTHLKNLEYIQELVNLGIQPTAESIISVPRLENLKYLVSLGLTPDSETVNSAILGRNLKMVQYLQKIGVPLNIYNLNTAVKRAEINIIKYIISQGIQPTTDSIEIASEGYLIQMIEKFKKEGRKYKAKTGDLANEQTYIQIIKILIQAGADPVRIVEIKGEPAVVSLLETVRYGNLEILKFLQSLGIELTHPLLTTAIHFQRFEMIKYLMAQGLVPIDYDLDVAYRDYMHVLDNHRTVNPERIKLIKFLYDQGLNIPDNQVVGDLELFKYFVSQRLIITDQIFESAINDEKLELIKYIAEETDYKVNLAILEYVDIVIGETNLDIINGEGDPEELGLRLQKLTEIRDYLLQYLEDRRR